MSSMNRFNHRQKGTRDARAASGQTGPASARSREGDARHGEHPWRRGRPRSSRLILTALFSRNALPMGARLAGRVAGRDISLRMSIVIFWILLLTIENSKLFCLTR